MWPIYTITGFDASAHTSEETVQAAHNVPEGHPPLGLRVGPGRLGDGRVVRARDARRRRGRAAGRRRLSLADGAGAARRAAGALLWVGIVVANYLCGLACMTSTSRMMYAFARDGGLPGSGLLKRVSPRWQTPVPAIWTTAALALASTLYAPAYSTLTTACVIFLYLSYVMPTLVGLRAFGRDLDQVRAVSSRRAALQDARRRVGAGRGAAGLDRRAAPQREGADRRCWRRPRLLLAAWWLGVRRRFRGPPVTEILAGDCELIACGIVVADYTVADCPSPLRRCPVWRTRPSSGSYATRQIPGSLRAATRRPSRRSR